MSAARAACDARARGRCRPTTTSPSARASAACAASTCCSTSAARWSAACAPSPSAAATPAWRAYLRAAAPATPPQLDEFLDRVTINVSHLWRNPEQWERLRHDVLPELAAERHACAPGAPAAPTAPRPTRSPPSAAERSRARRVEILGTDIDRRMVERARAASFTAEDVRDAPPSALARFFDRRRTSGWRPTPELRALVSLRGRRPAAHAARRPRAYDLVLCRNTVIYFNEDVRDALHARLGERAAPRRLPRRRRHRARRRARGDRPAGHGPLHLPQEA